MKTYKDYLPLNANVVIDYSAEEKDRVKFDYPIKYSYKKAIWRCAYVSVLSMWLKIWAIILYGSYTFYCMYKLLTLETASGIAPITLYEILVGLIPVVIGGYVFLGIPAIITYYISLDRYKLSIILPKLEKYNTEILGKIKEVTFIPKDVSDNKIIIAHFHNVYLDYVASGDFEKYLTRVEIKNLPHERRYNNIYFLFKKLKRIKYKKTNNDFSAKFIFSKTPINGKLKVKFI